MIKTLKSIQDNFVFFFFLPFVEMSLNRWGRRRAGAANAKLLRLFHAHFVCVLEDPVCVHPTDRVLEWLGMFHCVNLSHWFPNRYYWRPCIPFWLHSWPERHRHCSGFCGTGDFTSWWVILLVKGFIDIQRHIVRCEVVQFAHFTPLNSNGRCVKKNKKTKKAGLNCFHCRGPHFICFCQIFIAVLEVVWI